MTMSENLRAALAAIAAEAVADSILQPGAAFALGELAEAADCQPGWSTDDVADALRGEAPFVDEPPRSWHSARFAANGGDS